VKRPRGFVEGEPIPGSAYVAIPGAIAAAAVALAYEGQGGLGPLVRQGIQRAERAGAETRAELLKVVRGKGAQAFSDNAFVRPLLHVAGASEQGLLTSTDFGQLTSTIDVQAVAHPANEAWFETPWAQDMEGENVPSVDGNQIVVIAFDNRGVAAAASFQRVREGVSLDAMELVAPRAAVPVRRGVTRVVASPGKLRVDTASLDRPELRVRRDATGRRVIAERM
jgi:hypothetical protein